MEKKLIEIISVGHNETCVLSFPGSSEEMTFTADEVSQMYQTLGQACYTMGFKSGSTPEEYDELTNKISGFLGHTNSLEEEFISQGKSPEEILKIMAAKYGMDMYEFSDKEIEPNVLKMIPISIARQYRIVPVKYEDKVITVAMSDPSDLEALDSIRYILRLDVEAVIVSAEELEKALNRYYNKDSWDMQK